MLLARPCSKATCGFLQARSERASTHRFAGSRTVSRPNAIGKEQQQGASSEQQLSALRQSLLQEYAQQLNSHPRPSTPSSGGSRVSTKAKAATQQFAPAESATATDPLTLAASLDLPGQILHHALSNSQELNPSTATASPSVDSDLPAPAPKTPKKKKLSTSEQQALWIAAINTESPQSSIDEIPAANSYALKLPVIKSPRSPAQTTSPSPTPSPDTTSTLTPTSDTPSTPQTPGPQTAPASLTSSSAPPTPAAPTASGSSPATKSSAAKYAWINPRRRELLRLDLKEDLIPLAKYYGLDVYKTKVDVIDNLLQKEFAAFLKEREAALLKLPSREKLVPLAKSYGINPSGFKREVVAAIINQEFRRLTSSRKEELSSWEPMQLISYTQSCGINLYGDKGLLVGRILVHEAKLRAEFCSQVSVQSGAQGE